MQKECNGGVLMKQVFLSSFLLDLVKKVKGDEVGGKTENGGKDNASGREDKQRIHAQLAEGMQVVYQPFFQEAL